jgi:glycosyltransferase involved in cell wall biosynthesis
MTDNVHRSEAWRAILEQVPEAYGRPRLSLASRAGGYERGLVSIIIPCFNNGQFIAEAIDSALAQSYPACETVVIDDGSTDSSLGIIKSYGSRIRWRSKANGGASAARNDGLELARGEYIQFLDGDDLLVPDAVARRLEAMSADCDAVFGDMRSIDEHGEFDGILLRHESPSWPPADLPAYIVMNNIRTPEPIHRRGNVYRAGGFDEALPRSQEPDFHLRMHFLGHRFRHIPAYVALRRQHGHGNRLGNVNWMGSDPDRYLKLIRHWLGLLPPDYFRQESQQLPARLGDLLYDKANQAIGKGFPEVGRKYIQALLAAYPGYRPRGVAGRVSGVLGLDWGMRLDRLKKRVLRLRLGTWLRQGIRSTTPS